MASAFPFKSATGRFLPARSKAPRFKVMFDGKVLGRTFDTKPEAQGVADGLNKTMPGSATVLRANSSGGGFVGLLYFRLPNKGKQHKYSMLHKAGFNSREEATAWAREEAKRRGIPADVASMGPRDLERQGGIEGWAKHKGYTMMNPSAFDRCVASVEKRGGAVSPRGVCAAAGRKKYGKKKFQQMAIAGKRAAAKRRGNAKGMTGHKAVRAFFKTNDIDIIFNASPERAMSTLSSRTGIGHGVEHIDAREFTRKAPGQASIRGIDYVNMGDPYTKTLIHDGSKFVLGAWGDWIEKYGARKENSSTSTIGAELDALKRSIIELQDRFDKMPTFALGESLKKARAKYKKLGQQFMAVERRSRPNAKGGTDFSLYDAAKKADDAFQAALVKQYGGRAGDMRYQSAKHPAHIKALAKAKQKADERWLAEMRRGNPKLLTSIGQGSVRADVYAVKGGAHQVRMRGEAPKDFGSKDAAMKYARLRVHELAKNPAAGLAAAEQMVAGKQSLVSKLMRKLTGKKNPEASAEEMYQIFHGLPAEKVVEYREKIHVHEWLWAVGTLNNMQVSDGKHMIVLTAPDPNKNPFEDVVMVCMTEDGKQFHFRGGDQSLPLDGIAEAFGLTEDDVREHMEIGRIRQMTYRTRKIFEDRGQVNIDFYHDLGKEHAQNKLPLLVYKPLNPSMDIVGGRYKVAPLDKSIKASPGVVG